MRRPIIALLTMVALAILFVVLCTFVRKPYETVLLDRFGNVIEYSDSTLATHPPMMYHWYFKYPTDSVIRIDNRLHLYTSSLQQVNTAGSEPIAVRTFAAWRITKPILFYQTTGGSDDTALGLIGRKIGGLVSGKLTHQRLDNIFNMDEKQVRLPEIEKQIARDATEGSNDPAEKGEPMTGLKEQGLEIVQVGFARMAFPPDNANSVYNRMAAERNKQAEDYRTQGEALYSQLASEGDAAAAKIRGEATRDAEKVRGEGDREANAILASVQQSKDARDFYQYWKSLEFVKSSLSKNTVLLLPTDSDWLKALFVAPQNDQSLPSATQPAALPKTRVITPPSN